MIVTSVKLIFSDYIIWYHNWNKIKAGNYWFCASSGLTGTQYYINEIVQYAIRL
jgi:hypothetical protein